MIWSCGCLVLSVCHKLLINLLNNDICIAEIGQAVLESKVVTGNPHRSWKLSFSDFSNAPLVQKMM